MIEISLCKIRPIQTANRPPKMQSDVRKMQKLHVCDVTDEGKYPKFPCRQDRQRLFHSEKLGAGMCPMESARCTSRPCSAVAWRLIPFEVPYAPRFCGRVRRVRCCGDFHRHRRGRTALTATRERLR